LIFCQKSTVFFFLFSQICIGSGTTAHNPRLEVIHGLKEIRWLGDGESHPSLNRWLAVAIVDGLEVTHGQGCRSGGDPRQGCRLGLPCRISAGLEVTHGQACRLEVTHGQAHRISVCSVTVAGWKLRQKFSV
jgi:hypothetical protein